MTSHTPETLRAAIFKAAEVTYKPFSDKLAPPEQVVKLGLDDLMQLIVEHDAALLAHIRAGLPHHGGLPVGRNYWAGIARGRNDVLDEVTKLLSDMEGTS